MPQWKTLQLSRRGIALDPQSGDCFQLNSAAGLILTSMQQGMPVEAIADKLVSQFGVQRSEAISDIYDFESKLHALGLYP